MRNEDVNFIKQTRNLLDNEKERKETQPIGANQVLILPYQNNSVYDWTGVLDQPSPQASGVYVKTAMVSITSKNADFALCDLITEMRLTPTGAIYTYKDFLIGLRASLGGAVQYVSIDVEKVPLDPNLPKVQKYKVYLAGIQNQRVYLKFQVVATDDVEISVI